jgi:hypothetical protein
MSADRPPFLQIGILGRDQSAIGSGLLISERHILTCAHVVSIAVTGEERSDPPWGQPVFCRTIPWQGEPLQAKLVAGAWRDKDATIGDRGSRC